jgi:hypothetical protein
VLSTNLNANPDFDTYTANENEELDLEETTPAMI